MIDGPSNGRWPTESSPVVSVSMTISRIVCCYYMTGLSIACQSPRLGTATMGGGWLGGGGLLAARRGGAYGQAPAPYLRCLDHSAIAAHMVMTAGVYPRSPPKV